MKVLYYLTLIILNTLALGNPNLSNTTPDSLDLTSHPFYNTLYSRDCSIPEGTQVIHYPIYHASILEGNLEDLAIRSSFSFLQFLKEHPEAVVFPEKIWFANPLSEIISEVNKFVKHYFNFDMNTIDSIQNVKNKNSYNQLTEEEKKFLYATGGISHIFLGMPHQTYSVTLFTDEDEMATSYWIPHGMTKSNLRELMIETRIILLEQYLKLIELVKQFKNNSLTIDQTQEEFSSIYAEIKNLEKLNTHFLFQFRENLLFEAVEKRMNEPDNQNKLAVIFYGMAHDFSDEFKQVNFYTLPVLCVMDELPSTDMYIHILLGLSQFHPNDEVKQEILHKEFLRLWNSSSQEDRIILRQILSEIFLSQDLFTFFETFLLTTDFEKMDFETALNAIRNDNFRREIIFNSLSSMSEDQIQTVETKVTRTLERWKSSLQKIFPTSAQHNEEMPQEVPFSRTTKSP